MKTNNLLNQIIQLSQAELESMSITRQNTVVVKVNNEVELPIMQLRGADVTVGNGKVVACKERRRRVYCGAVTKAVHSFSTEYGESRLRVHKDGDVIFTFIGNVNMLHDRYDLIDALETSIDLMERDVYNDNLQKMQESAFQDWFRGKKAYDAREKKEERSWREREESDMEKIIKFGKDAV
ncbi:MAG: hypothetical protein J6035_03095 [Bacteroidaceae bacterium]|nr:hypothetical protein [Bacteroidaceae bacterium]